MLLNYTFELNIEPDCQLPYLEVKFQAEVETNLVGVTVGLYLSVPKLFMNQ